jgi:hypothetical protein
MATTKKQVTTYVTKEIEERLTAYCLAHDLTRKDKSGNVNPSWGTAVTEILDLFFTGKSERSNNTVREIVTKAEVLGMIRKELGRWSKNPLNTSIITSKNELLAMLHDASQSEYPDDPKPNDLFTDEELEIWEKAKRITNEVEEHPGFSLQTFKYELDDEYHEFPNSP